MATIKYRLHSKKGNVSIYLQLSIGRGNYFQRKTGLNINPKEWSTSTGLPKQTNPYNKNLTTDLRKLTTAILENLNDANSKGEKITGDWLNYNIDLHFDRINEDEESNLLIDHIQYIIDNAATKVLPGGRMGLSERRVKSYVTFKGIIEKYEKYYKKQIDLNYIDTKFAEDLKNWLFNIEDYSTGNVGRVFIDLKATCNDAIRHGKKVNHLAKTIIVPSVQKDERHIIPLSFDELEIIENLNNLSESLANTRKWLLIGCEIGQRGGDLLKITKDNFRIINENKEVIVVFQTKTKKDVTIGISVKVKKVIKNGFPYKISTQKFNKYLKDLCKIAEIDQPTEGEIYKMVEKGKKRKIKDVYPKYKLITSHVCRKSFSTNYYYKDVPIRILRGITGHSTDRQFLDYIGEQEDKNLNVNLMLGWIDNIEQKRKEQKQNRKAEMKPIHKKAN